MITLDRATAPATLPTPATTAPPPAIMLVPVHDGLWRVTRPDGEVLGYVETLEAGDGQRFRARRISTRLRRFVNIGEFWDMHDAVDCFANG